MKYALFCVLFSFISCEKQIPEGEKDVFKEYKHPDQISENYKTIVTELGVKKYELWTERLELYSTRKELNCLDSLIVKFFKSDEFTNTIIRSHSGTWNQKNNNIKAMTNVSVVSEDGKQLYTDTLYFDNKNNKIYSETDVMMVSGRDTTWGTSFQSDISLKNMTILNQRAVFQKH